MEEAQMALKHKAHGLLKKRPADRTQTDVETISEFIRTTPGCLSLLEPATAQILARHIGYEFWEPGHVGMREGRIVTTMYIAMEGHCQIYNLPEGEAGELLEASSVPAYEVYLKNNDNKPSFRQAAKAVIAGLPLKTASMEQVMNIGEQTGWIEQGDSFSEGALLDATRRAPCSVVAGQRGVHLLSLDRIAYGYFKSQAQSSAVTAEAVAALHGAMCLRALKDPPEMRSEEDVELLTDLMGAMQAFKHLPRELCVTLAEGMVHVRAPAGATIIEEGDQGECMYMLLSKSVEVRQRPEPEGLEFDMDNDDQSLITAITRATKHGRGSIRGVGGGSVIGGSMIGGQRSSLHAGGSVIGGRRSSVVDQSQLQSGKAKHFESAVNKKDMIISMDDEEADAAGLVVHDGNYWINKFLKGVQKAIPRMETQSGHDQESITPLAAVAAAKWKWMTFNEREAVRKKQEAIEWEKRVAKEAELKEAGAMHEVLGMGAAKAVNRWRQQALAARKADEEMMTMMQKPAASPPHRFSDNGKEAAEGAGAGDAPLGESGHPEVSSAAQDEGGDQAEGEEAIDDDLGPVPKSVLARQRWGTAGIAVNFAVRAHATIDPNKRMLNRMAQDADKLSEFMMGEMSRRADVEDVLQTVSKAMMRKGAPRRLSVANSKRLYEAIKATINRGASDRGFAARGGDNRSLRSLSQGSNVSGDFETMTRASSVASLGDHPDLMVDIAEDEELADELSPFPSPTGHRKTHLTRDMLAGTEVQLVGVGPDGMPVKRLLEEDDETYFGPLVRTLKPGSTFGELSLLQKTANRTASVLVPAPAEPEEEGQGNQVKEEEAKEEAKDNQGNPEAKAPQDQDPCMSKVGGSLFHGVELIRITRECYDSTVNHLMVKQLQDLLHFLGEVEPFKELPAQHLSSLAVFMRPVTVQKGTVIAREGDMADNLYIIREGDVRVLAQYDHGVSEILTMGAAPKWNINNRTITHINTLHNPATPAQMRALGRSVSDKSMDVNKPTLDRSPSGNRSAVVGRWGGSGGINGAGIVVHGGAEVSDISKLAPLAVLGKGQTFGEELLGRRISEDEEFEQHYYGSTVVATSLNVKLLEISSRDLRRFGRKVVDAVVHYSRLRAKWHNERLSSCLKATVAAAQAIEHLGEVSLEELMEKPKVAPQTVDLGSAPLMPASLIIARRRSDSVMPGIETTTARRRWSHNLPPQLSLNIPPPPGGGSRFPPIHVDRSQSMRDTRDSMRPPSREFRRVVTMPTSGGTSNRRHSMPDDALPSVFTQQQQQQEGLQSIHEASRDGYPSGYPSRTSSASSHKAPRPTKVSSRPISRDSSFGSSDSSKPSSGRKVNKGKLSQGRPPAPGGASRGLMSIPAAPPSADMNFSISGTAPMRPVF